MNRSTIWNAFPLVSSIALFGLLILQHRKGEQRDLQLRAQADSALRSLSNLAARRDSLVEAGQYLPNVLLAGGTQSQRGLRDLARRHRFIYLRSGSCAGCEIVDAALSSADAATVQAVARVDYDVDNAQDPHATDALVLDRRSWSTAPWPFWGVPTLIVVDTGGRVHAIAHANLERVRDLLALHGIVDPAVVDSIRDLRQTSARLPLNR